ncbi:MAG: hypothetical protein ACJ73V_01525 [Acidimicrobiia bacterium]
MAQVARGGDSRRGEREAEEVIQVARGIATAVAPEGGLTDVQAALLEAIASALTQVEVDYHGLEPLGPEELAAVLAGRDQHFRQRIVHHMVLGELVLRPLPTEVALRVARYAQALGVDDRFVRVARRYAQGAFGLAWMDLQRSGFTEHVRRTDTAELRTVGQVSDPFTAAEVDPELEARWAALRDLPEGSLGRAVWELYDSRGFALPGSTTGASAYLAQHDFVHVLADYGTNLKGELEVFAFIGRADPDPKGFAWLATLIGLFETGYIADTGFFERDVRERTIQAPGMHRRIADAILRGKLVSESCGTDLFEVDYHEMANVPVSEVRSALRIPEKSPEARTNGSAGAFERAGMSELQRRIQDERAPREPQSS